MKREIMEGRSFGKWEVLSYDGCYATKNPFTCAGAADAEKYTE